MRKTIWILLLFGLFSCKTDPQEGTQGILPEFKDFKLQYPETYRDTSVADDYFGVKVMDPYRWLEDENAPATRGWIDQEQSLTNNYMKYIPYRDAIQRRLTQLWNYERYSTPVKKGDYYYLFKNDGLQNQDVLFRMAKLDSPLEVVLDPNRFSGDGTVSLGSYAFSQDGSLLAYEASQAGSDWRTVMIRDLAAGRNLKDTVRWVKFSEIAWFRDGFFYSRYPEPKQEEALTGSNQFHQVYYHKVGTPQSEDILAFADRRNPKRNVYAQTTDDERFLILKVIESTSGNALYFRDLSTDDPSFIPIVENFDNDFEVIGSDENSFYVLTNYKASNRRLLRISTRQPGARYWQEVIPASGDVLRDAYFFGGKLIAHYLHDASSQLKVFSSEGQEEKTIELPGIGTVLGVSGRADSPEAFYEFSSLIQPGAIYRLGLDDFNQSVYKQPKSDFDTDAYEIKQVRYQSYDGTEIPMFIVHRKGMKLEGAHPTLLYGYGGFNIPVLPSFNRTRYMLFPVVLENGGVCAVANIRGGGEFGTAWHEAGTKHRKQNVFDDFQGAAEYLIANQYTNPSKLAIHGASNGGLLVGACLVQRPDLYAVALPAVGVLDMLRYQNFTIGWAWADDYGLSDNKEDFDYLFAYSPLHNITRQKYPATMITTADHDDRVVPAHSFKFAASLQAHQEGKEPILIRIEPSAGHGAGSPTSKRIEAGADMLAFMLYNMKEGVVYSATAQEDN
ncbi:MAG: S9 family peptidase [Lewinellaceae bacterium]|nr:S9 family peptidase [Phaeodactylibacter sp.]MCB0612106.1 S9 family peptidase [Phaeodactylibacter sp.]MCB9349078.1 S9 family peptidase [Lewinellaceae bacterium]